VSLDSPAEPRPTTIGLVGRPRSFRTQIVVLTAAVTAGAMVLLTVVLQLVLAQITNGDADRVLANRADSVITSIQAQPDSGAITVPDAILDPGVAVFDDSAELVAGSTPPSLHEYYEELATSPTTVVAEARGNTRVRAQPFTTADGVRGVVIVTERLDPYEEAERLALIVSLVTGLLATAAAAAIAAWTMRRALRPVAEMAATASDWSEHDLGRRFAMGPPTNEIRARAATLDALLDRVSSAIRSEQRLTAELAHELRTPLTSIQGTADLLLLRDGASLTATARADLEEVSAASRRMATTITTLLELARTDATIVAAGSCSAREVVAEVVAHADNGRVELDVDVEQVRISLPHALAVRAVSPVVENAVRFARTSVTLTSSVQAGGLEIHVTDDGPGVEAALLDDMFEPGRTSGTSAGAGLGLAISRRIARTAGGDVRVAEPDGDGARFVILLPLS
jgi:signal transduction histidine kinase